MIKSMFLQPEWPAPTTIKAFTTLRLGGVSLPPYNAFNLACHVDDSIEYVLKNRLILQENLKLPSEPIWINQIHSNIVVPALKENRDKQADASYTGLSNTVCAILTADCLPILLCNRQGTYVSAIHAGWRGLSNGIIDNILYTIPCAAQDLVVWLGPAIGPEQFEVGDDVRDLFLKNDQNSTIAFKPSKNNRWLCDIYAIARLQFKKHHITQIYGGEYCTYSDPAKFFSYRRDGAKTGRMASLIWISDSRHLD